MPLTLMIMSGMIAWSKILPRLALIHIPHMFFLTLLQVPHPDISLARSITIPLRGQLLMTSWVSLDIGMILMKSVTCYLGVYRGSMRRWGSPLIRSERIILTLLKGLSLTWVTSPSRWTECAWKYQIWGSICSMYHTLCTVEVVLDIAEAATDITEPPTTFYLTLFPPCTKTLWTMCGSSVGEELSRFIFHFFNCFSS